MKYYRLLITIISLIITLSSCEDENHQDSSFQDSPMQSYESNETEYSLLTVTPNVYQDYFKDSDRTLGLSAVKNDPLGTHNTFKRTDVNENEPYRINLNGLEVTSKGGGGHWSKGQIDNIFGTEVSVSIQPRNGMSFKNGITKKRDVFIYSKENKYLQSRSGR